jgi:pyridoxamine 5'-phosphate oxidase
MNLADLREDYTKGGISRSDLPADPFDQFSAWLKTAHEQEIPDANAMTVATADARGVVTSRTLLLKGLVDGKLQFFTNYRSRKARDLAENPHAAITIHWKELERQICVRGTVRKTPRSVSESYFRSRPYGSQIGAWVSEEQSGIIEDRNTIKAREASLMKKFPEGTPVPCPDFWGGYELAPNYLEFWQGRQGRLHDRLCYLMEEGAWVLRRLSP